MRHILAAFLIMLGVAFGGVAIGKGMEQFRQADRFVTVKGLVEQEAKADLAVWPLRFTATGGDLAMVQEKIDQDMKVIQEFLTQNGLSAEEMIPGKLEVVDLLAQQYRSGEIGGNRFILSSTLLVRSENVDLIYQLSQKTGEIVKKGVVMSEGYSPGPYYLFTKLNEVKPAMLAEATENARLAADQFAKDSNAKLAGIRRANQGNFAILPRDQFLGASEDTQPHKMIRAVVTVDYFLADK